MLHSKHGERALVSAHVLEWGQIKLLDPHFPCDPVPTSPIQAVRSLFIFRVGQLALHDGIDRRDQPIDRDRFLE